MPETEVKASKPSADDVYDIAAVCRLTGLTAPGLRMWEKRHQAVNPGRTKGGHRQYSRREIQRLTLLKALSDRGHGIRTLVGLPIVELERRLEECSKVSSSDASVKGWKENDKVRRCRIAVIGEHLVTTVKIGSAFVDDEATITEFKTLEDAESCDTGFEADLVFVEISALFDEEVNRVRRIISRFRALRAILVYAYAQERTLEKISDDSGLISAIRAPVSLSELREACETDIALAGRSASAIIDEAPKPKDHKGGIRKRKYSNSQIAKASNISSAVDCECPNHLAALLKALNGFEEYSAQCENRNTADAKIHAYLHMMTAHARATIEDALEVLVEFEDIDIGDPSSS